MHKNPWNVWRIGIVIACMTAVFAGWLPPQALAKGAEPFPAEEETKFSAEEMLRLVNQVRQEGGEKPLVLSDDLMKAAAVRAQELAKSFSHTRPDGTPFHTVLGREQGVYTLGENAAAGSDSVEAVMIQWMDSPGHRRNILDARFREMGVDHFYAKDSEYKHYWIQIFRS